jgi:hypothetical protein
MAANIGGLRRRLGWALMRLAGRLLGSEVKQVEPGPADDREVLTCIVPYGEHEAYVNRALGADEPYVRQPPMRHPTQDDLYVTEARWDVLPGSARPDGLPESMLVTLTFGKPPESMTLHPTDWSAIRLTEGDRYDWRGPIGPTGA